MNLLFAVLGILIALLAIGITLYLLTARPYQTADSVATGISAQFQVDDAMALSFPDASFDVVWSIEAGPHMPDKAVFAKELMRVLKPGSTNYFINASSFRCRVV